MPTNNADKPSDLLFAVAHRAQQLADMSAREVRLNLGGFDSDTRGGAIAATRGMTKGQVIEAILLEEFDDAAKRLNDQYDCTWTS